ncbi:MAG: 1-deoxy-D-xylulose-5-phosphate reductoisomerase [Alphaproteobacteria bacterium]
MSVKTISIFGSTGSIGQNAIGFIKNNPDKWHIKALTAHSNVDLLILQAKELNPEYAVIANENMYDRLKEGLAGTNIKIKVGFESVKEVANIRCDIILMAITGIAALLPTISAIEIGSNIALANKEAIVCAGELMINKANEHNVKILPVDSEHNAIYQILQKEQCESIEKLYLTASGGPFRTFSLAEMENVKLEDALKHPNWSMGQKITIDSATMVNKALELIEAHYLFNLPEHQIDIIVHPESIIHGMVSFKDGAILAELGAPDMLIPISYALCWPERALNKISTIDFIKLSSLNFEQIDYSRFPAPLLARNCLNSSNKNALNIVFNAANEVAVNNFINCKIKFLDIVRIIDAVLQKSTFKSPASIDDIIQIDKETRNITLNLINN